MNGSLAELVGCTIVGIHSDSDSEDGRRFDRVVIRINDGTTLTFEAAHVDELERRAPFTATRDRDQR